MLIHALCYPVNDKVLSLCQYLLNRTLNILLLLHVFLYETKQVVLVLESFSSKSFLISLGIMFRQKQYMRSVILIKLQAENRNFTKSNTPPLVFFTFFNTNNTKSRKASHI